MQTRKTPNSVTFHAVIMQKQIKNILKTFFQTFLLLTGIQCPDFTSGCYSRVKKNKGSKRCLSCHLTVIKNIQFYPCQYSYRKVNCVWFWKKYHLLLIQPFGQTKTKQLRYDHLLVVYQLYYLVFYLKKTSLYFVDCWFILFLWQFGLQVISHPMLLGRITMKKCCF